ncbi:MAG: hypothetical protein AB7O97_16640 [Planctomycetota bacterium]
MKLASARLWLSLSCCAAVVAFAASNLGKTLPGPLSAAHAQVEDLDGGNSCSQCHGGWFSDLQASCLKCHADIEGQLAEHRGLHGALEPDRARTCGLCHSEHHGGDFALINRASWSLAGFESREAFDHRRVGFALDGRHLDLDCSRCHTNADAAPLAAGERRFLGLQRDCAACHHDVHDGAMRVRCDQCHGQQSFAEPASTGHERYLALDGAHGALACTACHPEGSPRAVLALGRTELRDPRGCADCHASPHQRLARAAAEPPAAPGGEAARGAAPARHGGDRSCGECHQPEHRTFLDARAVMTPQLHRATGFSLDAPHDAVTCGQCHAPGGTFAERHPGRTQDGCASCHDDPHGGQFADSALAGAGCVSCHERRGFAPHAFTAERHARTALPLDGAHADAACADCHARERDDLPRRFHGTKSRCEACHTDGHGRAFASVTGELQQDARGTCAVCHGTASFGRDGAPFDHGRYTGFRLDGAHALAACETCHPRAEQPDANGRTFGHTAAHAALSTGCGTCHDDVHQGRFDRPGMPAAVDGRRDCARCHDTASFRAFPQGFDHGRWTGFALHGAHGKAACSSCHIETGLVASGDVAAPLGTRCADCHREPHGGQFAAAWPAPGPGAAGMTDCRRCHRDGLSFGDLKFDHDTDARFRLGSAHQKVPCASCHRPIDTGPGAEHPIVRYRPVPRECTDCHGQQQDPLRRQTRRRQEDR